MSKHLDYRVYRTEDGRHVREGDTAAAFLAYAPGESVPVSVLREMGEAEDSDDAEAKSVAPSADKQADASEDKSGGVKITKQPAK